MGRVARMPGTGLPKESRRKRKTRRGNRTRKNRRKVVRTWSFVICGFAFAILGTMIWLWLLPNMFPEEEEVVARSPVKAAVVARVASKFPSPPERDALAMVKHALSIREAGQIAGYFRTGGANPQEVVDFLRGMEAKDGAITDYKWLSSMDANGLPIDGVLVSFKSEGKPLNRLALLTPDAAGKWQIDFDAFARTVKPAWQEILAKRAGLAQVRVYIAKDSYYNGPFKDDKLWSCYGIVSPDTEEVLLGYCKTGTPQAASLERIFSKEVPVPRAILEIRRVEGAEPRQLEISRVLAEDWVMGDTPFDEQSK